MTSGSNLTYYIDVRRGIQDESLMYESAYGPMSIFYNGYSYGAHEEKGIYLKRVIYIPQETENIKEAYIKAAQKRINDYLGNESVVVSYGGLLTSLPEYSEDVEYPITSDGNYYNIKFGSRTYKFYIVKGSQAQLVAPTYAGLDLNSKIEITSKDSSIPLDTSLTVNTIEDASIKDVIGTDNYKSYDIRLYSSSQNSKVEKLENGTFLVKMPIPTELNDKELIVYSLLSNGEKEEHVATKEGEYVSFETNHFSTYVLAEKKVVDNNDSTKNEENPDTYDGLMNWIMVSILSLDGIVGISLYRKKQNI